eukprot:c586_g1_i2.p1 GENE.c586_g1_i2~~c586_g1_i2.p1  ORF type:complete len:201 (+),score=30.25 c586_g1_i2:1-603(+)
MGTGLMLRGVLRSRVLLTQAELAPGSLLKSLLSSEMPSGCCGGAAQKQQPTQSTGGCCGGSAHHHHPHEAPALNQGIEPEEYTPSPGPPSAAMELTRSDMLSLYRYLIKEGLKMPTQNRRDYVRGEVRSRFKMHANLTDEKEIDLQRRLALTVGDAIRVQQEHLNKLFASDIAAEIEKQRAKRRREEKQLEDIGDYFGKM